MQRTTKDAADKIGVAQGTLENWRSQGRGPKFLKLGGKVLYRDRDLDAYLDSCSRSSTAEKPQKKPRKR